MKASERERERESRQIKVSFRIIAFSPIKSFFVSNKLLIKKTMINTFVLWLKCSTRDKIRLVYVNMLFSKENEWSLS
jgi:hypothetical protein